MTHLEDLAFFRDIDPVLLGAHRLRILLLLRHDAWCRLGFIRDTLALNATTLSRQVATLRAAAYVETYTGVRGRTWLRLTAVGDAQTSTHIEAIRYFAELVNDDAPPDDLNPSNWCMGDPA
ncbi:transcriptional regulator [Amycolatopsis sp. H20-H5]|uniref:transcriptional regulator n=1 Tax=Amycolatopsis sp. H20-H5 TaxID=3046309 RepID=UPI002DC0170D|nr:transcriptional regulator [Amycolatopsis sp. H20-H5]MEC3974882.1 transcriptional regulator [Amycolatopsis sp. H20-H5]